MKKLISIMVLGLLITLQDLFYPSVLYAADWSVQLGESALERSRGEDCDWDLICHLRAMALYIGMFVVLYLIAGR